MYARTASAHFSPPSFRSPVPCGLIAAALSTASRHLPASKKSRLSSTPPPVSSRISRRNPSSAKFALGTKIKGFLKDTHSDTLP